MIQHDTIYKIDSVGKTRVWSQQQDGPSYRTVAGIEGGALVESGWTICKGKQGRNDTEQAAFEVASNYENKLTREYHRTRQGSAGGAHFYKPMLAQTYAGFPGHCYAQPKLDGIRCIATIDGLFSRQGKPIVAVPHIHSALAPVFQADPTIVLDGELYNHELRDDFGEISSIVRKSNPTVEALEKAEAVMQYHIYDVPSEGELPFVHRAAKISILIGELDCSWLVPVETVGITSEHQLNEVYGRWLEAGYEGQMVRLNAPYEQKRSKSLLKRKEFQSEEFPVISIEEGLGNWAGVAKAVRCSLPDGRVFGAGIRGSRDRAAALLRETYATCTVRFFALTPDGVPRFPVVTDFHNAERVD